jgi:hypothetical protein
MPVGVGELILGLVALPSEGILFFLFPSSPTPRLEE